MMSPAQLRFFDPTGADISDEVELHVPFHAACRVAPCEIWRKQRPHGEGWLIEKIGDMGENGEILLQPGYRYEQ